MPIQCRNEKYKKKTLTYFAMIFFPLKFDLSIVSWLQLNSCMIIIYSSLQWISRFSRWYCLLISFVWNDFARVRVSESFFVICKIYSLIVQMYLFEALNWWDGQCIGPLTNSCYSVIRENCDRITFSLHCAAVIHSAFIFAFRIFLSLTFFFSPTNVFSNARPKCTNVCIVVVVGVTTWHLFAYGVRTLGYANKRQIAHIYSSLSLNIKSDWILIGINVLRSESLRFQRKIKVTPGYLFAIQQRRMRYTFNENGHSLYTKCGSDSIGAQSICRKKNCN